MERVRKPAHQCDQKDTSAWRFCPWCGKSLKDAPCALRSALPARSSPLKKKDPKEPDPPKLEVRIDNSRCIPGEYISREEIRKGWMESDPRITDISFSRFLTYITTHEKDGLYLLIFLAVVIPEKGIKYKDGNFVIMKEDIETSSWDMEPPNDEG